jgi:hypothetical protein
MGQGQCVLGKMKQEFASSTFIDKNKSDIINQHQA